MIEYFFSITLYIEILYTKASHVNFAGIIFLIQCIDVWYNQLIQKLHIWNDDSLL